MLQSRALVTVRYAETDMMGIVYHGSYLPWFEIGRTTLLKEIGLPYRQLEAEGYRAFLEIGPSPTLLSLGQRCVADPNTALWLPSLRVRPSTLGAYDNAVAPGGNGGTVVGGKTKRGGKSRTQ